MTLEPAAPPIRGVDTAKVAYNAGGGLSWGVANSPIAYEPAITDAKELQTVLETQAPSADKVPCYVQQEPARKLKNLQNIPGAASCRWTAAITGSTTTASRSGSTRPA